MHAAPGTRQEVCLNGKDDTVVLPYQLRSGGGVRQHNSCFVFATQHGAIWHRRRPR